MFQLLGVHKLLANRPTITLLPYIKPKGCVLLLYLCDWSYLLDNVLVGAWYLLSIRCFCEQCTRILISGDVPCIYRFTALCNIYISNTLPFSYWYMQLLCVQNPLLSNDLWWKFVNILNSPVAISKWCFFWCMLLGHYLAIVNHSFML